MVADKYKNSIVSSNDYMEDFIDSKIEFKEEGKIGKQELINCYLEMYPSHKRSMQQFISAMKDKGITYVYIIKPITDRLQLSTRLDRKSSCR
jgi:hypothetical protein